MFTWHPNYVCFLWLCFYAISSLLILLALVLFFVYTYLQLGGFPLWSPKVASSNTWHHNDFKAKCIKQKMHRITCMKHVFLVENVSDVDSEGAWCWCGSLRPQSGDHYPTRPSSRAWTNPQCGSLLSLWGGLCGAHLQPYLTSVRDILLQYKRKLLSLSIFCTFISPVVSVATNDITHYSFFFLFWEYCMCALVITCPSHNTDLFLYTWRNTILNKFERYIRLCSFYSSHLQILSPDLTEFVEWKHNSSLRLFSLSRKSERRNI